MMYHKTYLCKIAVMYEVGQLCNWLNWCGSDIVVRTLPLLVVLFDQSDLHHVKPKLDF